MKDEENQLFFGEEDQHLIMIKSDIYFATILYIYGVSMHGKIESY